MTAAPWINRRMSISTHLFTVSWERVGEGWERGAFLLLLQLGVQGRKQTGARNPR